MLSSRRPVWAERLRYASYIALRTLRRLFPGSCSKTLRVLWTLFRVRQPADSAGGRADYCLRAIYATKEGADAVEAACGVFLRARPLRERVAS